MTETYTPDRLLAGAFPKATQEVTVAAGNNLARGTVLGMVTADGKCLAVDSALENGAEKPYAILAEPVDATDADAVGMAYLSGSFNQNALVFGGTDTVDTHRDALRDLSIYLKDSIRA